MKCSSCGNKTLALFTGDLCLKCKLLGELKLPAKTREKLRLTSKHGRRIKRKPGFEPAAAPIATDHQAKARLHIATTATKRVKLGRIEVLKMIDAKLRAELRASNQFRGVRCVSQGNRDCAGPSRHFPEHR